MKLLQSTHRSISVVESLWAALASVCLFAIMVIVFLDVGLRYIFNSPLGWSYDVISLYLMVALFFLTVSIGSALSGVLAAFYDPADASAERAYFLVLGVASIAVAVVMALLAPWIRKRMVGVR